MQKRILIDLDGVLADFHGHALGLFDPAGRTVEDLAGAENTYIPDFLGITEAEFWRLVNLNSRKFWYEMPKLPDADQIMAICLGSVGLKNVGICTSPSRDSQSIHWKLEWVKEHFGNMMARQMVVTPAKHLCAGPHTMLIDDWLKNQHFESPEYGGSFLHLPRMWNERHAESCYSVSIVRRSVSRLMNGWTGPGIGVFQDDSK